MDEAPVVGDSQIPEASSLHRGGCSTKETNSWPPPPGHNEATFVPRALPKKLVGQLELAGRQNLSYLHGIIMSFLGICVLFLGFSLKPTIYKEIR